MDLTWGIVIFGTIMVVLWAILGRNKADPLMLAEQALDEGKVVRAEMQAERALRLARQRGGDRSLARAEAGYVLGRAIAMGGELDRALEAFAEARAAEPPEAELDDERQVYGRLLVAHAVNRLREEDEAGAGAAFEQALDLLPTDGPMARMCQAHQAALSSGERPWPFEVTEQRLAALLTEAAKARLPEDLLDSIHVRYGQMGELQMAVELSRDPASPEEEAEISAALEAARGELELSLTGAA